jgi:hypothetical protein
LASEVGTQFEKAGGVRPLGINELPKLSPQSYMGGAPSELESFAKDADLLNPLGRPKEGVGEISNILDRRMGVSGPKRVGVQTMTDIPEAYKNPMAIPDKPTTHLRPSKKPPGVL